MILIMTLMKLDELRDSREINRKSSRDIPTVSDASYIVKRNERRGKAKVGSFTANAHISHLSDIKHEYTYFVVLCEKMSWSPLPAQVFVNYHDPASCLIHLPVATATTTTQP